jgi:hypothetical protein
MPDTDRIFLNVTPFAPVRLREHDTITMDIGILPGTCWRVSACGPGVLTAEALSAAFNRELSRNFVDISRLRGTRGQFTFDLAGGVFRNATIEYAAEYDYIDASMFGSRFTMPLPGTNRQVLARESYRIADPISAEQVARSEERDREYTRQIKNARTKAHETLTRMLNDQQKKDFKERGYFYVTGNKGTPYRVRTNSTVGNVDWIDGETVLGSYCAHPSGQGRDLNGRVGSLPLYDIFIGQKLALETDEESFLRVANLYGGTYPPVVSNPGRRVPPPFPGGNPYVVCDCPMCRGQARVPIPPDPIPL